MLWSSGWAETLCTNFTPKSKQQHGGGELNSVHSEDVVCNVQYCTISKIMHQGTIFILVWRYAHEDPSRHIDSIFSACTESQMVRKYITKEEYNAHPKSQEYVPQDGLSTTETQNRHGTEGLNPKD